MTQYISNIDEINLGQFKKCLKDEYSCLLLKGDYNEDEAKSIWFAIYDEYNEALSTKGNNTAFQIQKRLYTLPNKKYIVDVCLFVITELLTLNHINFKDIHGFDEFIKIISEFGFKFDSKDPVESLKRIKQQVKNYDTQIKREVKTLEEIEKRGEGWTFNKTVLAVGRFMGWQIKDSISVRDFVDMLNMMLTPKEDGKRTN
jgi:hypothetical protein